MAFRKKRNNKSRACTYKRKHKSQEAAFAALRRMRKKAPDFGLNLRPYKCRYCKQWHLGNKSAYRD